MVSSGKKPGGQPARPAPERPASATRLLLPYVLIGAIVSLVLVWDYVINQAQATGAFSAFWQAFTTRFLDPANHANLVTSPWLLILVLLTWLLGGGLALAETYRNLSDEKPLSAPSFRWAANAGIYFGVVILAFFLYGLFQGGMTQYQGLQVRDIFQRISSTVPIFDFVLLVFGLVLASIIAAADRRPRPYSWVGRPAMSATATILLPIFVFLAIFAYNVKPVEADIFYKQGQAYEDAGQPEGAVAMYNQAALMEPREDFYYLFLGRALLEFTSLTQPGKATLPADVSKVPTDQLLLLAQNGLVTPPGASTPPTEDIVRAANAVLVAGQRLNPLNTDHTANLARLYRSWAFISVPGVDTTSAAALRQALKDHPDQADATRLDQSLAYYQKALSLSPNNAGLWDEQAFVRLIKGDTKGALADLDRSLSLDKQYEQTYLYRGDALADQGDTQGALDAYRKALALNAKDETALVKVGYYAAQLRDTTTALAAYKTLIELEAPQFDSARQKFSALDAQVKQAGGYDKLDQATKANYQALQANVELHREQLYIAYQNQALVLRDAGQKQEALQAAQDALAHASASEQPAIQQLVAELQKQ